jgi:hypothetical protein
MFSSDKQAFISTLINLLSSKFQRESISIIMQRDITIFIKPEYVLKSKWQ